VLGHILKIFIAFALGLGVVLATVSSSYSASAEQQGEQGATKLEVARNKIQHVVVIMQENRSFDNYFGTYPGADGLPRAQDGEFAVCVPNPRTGGCDEPYHDSALVNSGGAHNPADGAIDIDNGKMDGFVAVAESRERGCGRKYARGICAPSTQPDVMGYHDAREIPNYWTYAQRYVLQDHMFQPDLSWSLPAHLFTVSGWSARCPFGKDEPSNCKNDDNLANFTGFGPPLVGGGGINNIPSALLRCIGRRGVHLSGDTDQPSPNDPTL
jgi:phospholipase C